MTGRAAQFGSDDRLAADHGSTHITPEQVRRARLLVASKVGGAGELAVVLEMLGIDPQTTSNGDPT